VTEERLRRWLRSLLATPGLTSISDPDEAWRVHVEQSLEPLELVRALDGPIVDVGSGGGAPGIPLAAALPDREVTLLEANERKVAFLKHAATEFPNVRVVRGRAEEQELERFELAVAKALAAPPVALEWCLPLVRIGGGALLYVGSSASAAVVSSAARQLGGAPAERHGGTLFVRKVEPTPARFPRRAGIARKRPLV